MKSPNLVRTLGRVCVAFAGLVFLAAIAPAQTPATGTVAGRVLNTTNGTYLQTAHVTVEGTQLETFTNQYGEFQLDQVPAGEAKVKVFYTGIAPQVVSVNVVAGQTTTRDFELSSLGSAPTAGAGDVVKLDAFSVSAQKDTDQKSIAINEQRFSPILKSVVSTDQFGDVTEGNVGEFLKYMPGVSLEYTSPDARQIILRGVNPIYTAMSVDGNTMASAASSGANRFFELEQASINSASRVEVTFSRTADMPASALGGGVNMISKSAFEVAHPQLTFRGDIAFNGDNLDARKTPGPFDHSEFKWKPSFDLSYLRPVSKSFGFAINASSSYIFYPQHRSQPTWTPNSAGAGGTAANPFLRTFQVQDGPKDNQRYNFSTKIDFKLGNGDSFSVTPQWNYYDAPFGNRNLTWNVQGTANTIPTAWNGPTFVQSAPTAGNVAWGTSFRHKFGTTYQLDTKYQHRGSVWTIEGGTSVSHASNHYQDYQDGHFENIGLSIKNVQVRFDGMNLHDYTRPDTITVSNAAGPIDSFGNLGAYTITNANYNPADSTDFYRSATTSAKRDFDILGMPTTLKIGGIIQDHRRDIRKPTSSLTFVGPDGVAGTADDLASKYDIADTAYSSTPTPLGLPQVTYPSPYKLYNLYLAHPEYFTTNQATNITNSAKNSQYIDEWITAAYMMADSRLLDNRLRLNYGIRFERTDDYAQGYLQDVNAQYQKDANGNPVKVNGAFVVLNGPNGKLLTDSSNATLLAQLQYKDRGQKGRNHYAGGYPNVAATFNVTENLLARASYTRALGRPDFGNIIPGTVLPDPSGSTYTISINNTALAAEEANNYDLALDYYFSKVGVLSLGVYRKDIANFFGSSSVPVTPELLTLYGIPDPDFYLQNSALLKSNFNVGTARVTGLQVDYKQTLTWVPLPQGHSLGMFVSGYANHLQGAALADFTNYIAKTFNTGFSYDARRFNVKFNMNYRGQQRLGFSAITGVTGAYTYFKPRTQFDTTVNVPLTRNLQFFVNGRNIFNKAQDQMLFGNESLGFTHLSRREEFGAQWWAGIKGNF